MASVLRAVFGYLFLILMVRVVGRRPGKQISPFEFILIFFLGGLTLTGIVGDEVSIASAFCQIVGADAEVSRNGTAGVVVETKFLLAEADGSAAVSVGEDVAALEVGGFGGGGHIGVGSPSR